MIQPNLVAGNSKRFRVYIAIHFVDDNDDDDGDDDFNYNDDVVE